MVAHGRDLRGDPSAHGEPDGPDSLQPKGFQVPGVEAGHVGDGFQPVGPFGFAIAGVGGIVDRVLLGQGVGEP